MKEFFTHRNQNNPLWMLSALWPLALLVPAMLRVLPRPPVSGGWQWRQELWIALLLCLTLLWLCRAVWRKRAAMNIEITRRELFIIVPLGSFVLWNAASMWWAESAAAAFHHSMVWAGYFLFFMLMLRAAKRPRLIAVSMTVLAFVVWIIAACAMIEFLGGGKPSFHTAIGFGEPTAVAVPMFAAIALRLRAARAALLSGATAAVAWLATLQTMERAPTIAAFVALSIVCIAAAAIHVSRVSRLRRIGLLFAAILCVTVMQSMMSPPSGDHPGAVSRLVRTTTLAEENTQVRFLFWGAAIEMWRDAPVIGVGANNYEVAFPEGRAQFARRYPDSPLLSLNEAFLAQRTHNEYLQMLAEIGLIGFLLFVLFCAALMRVSGRAIFGARHRSFLPLAMFGGLAAFAISSGASSISFRWMGSGLMFFFAAAVITRFAVETDSARSKDQIILSPIFGRAMTASAFMLALIMFGAMSVQGMGAILHGIASSGLDTVRAERFYRASLAVNPNDPATNYSYGLLLRAQGRAAEALPGLRYATRSGFNTSAAFGYLISAEMAAGELAAAERTARHAATVYPRSIFLLTRHASTLAAIGRTDEAEAVYARARTLDERAARGWWELINHGLVAANDAATRDIGIAKPGELYPETCVFTLLIRDELNPLSANAGGR